MPPPSCRRLRRAGFLGAMIDTAGKDGRRLTDHLPLPALAAFTARLPRARPGLGPRRLPGALRHRRPGRPSAPDYLGFRGGLCRGGDRTARPRSRRGWPRPCDLCAPRPAGTPPDAGAARPDRGEARRQPRRRRAAACGPCLARPRRRCRGPLHRRSRRRPLRRGGAHGAGRPRLLRRPRPPPRPRRHGPHGRDLLATLEPRLVPSPARRRALAALLGAGWSRSGTRPP